MLYEQNVIAIAPAMATIFLVPMLSIRRKAPANVIKRYDAGLFPLISVLYMALVQSPSNVSVMAVVGMPENMEPVHAVGSSGLALLWERASCAIPFHPAISLWSTILP